MAGVDEKTVEIPRPIDIAKTHDGAVSFGNHGEMAEKRLVPFLEIDMPVCPGFKLRSGIVRLVNGMNRRVENIGDRFAI